MKFTQQYTVKWHDTDASRRMRPSMYLVYMQETANLHLKAFGIPLDTLRDERGLAFLLSRITLRIEQPLYAYDNIEVQTWICESHGLHFGRCYCILRDGKVAAEAYADWGLMDLKAKRLLRSNEFDYGFAAEAPLPAEFSKRVRYPSLELMEQVGLRKIVYSDIDYNGHMNNTHYPDLLCDFTPHMESRRVTGFSLSFLHEAALDHTLKVYRSECHDLPSNTDRFLFRTVNESGAVCLEGMLITAQADEVREGGI